MEERRWRRGGRRVVITIQLVQYSTVYDVCVWCDVQYDGMICGIVRWLV